MRKLVATISICVLFVIFSGCGSQMDTENNASPEVLFSKYKSIDLFIFEEIAYVNVKDVDWVKELHLVKGECVGEIRNTGVTEKFENWDATLLEKGTKVYTTDQENLLVVEVEEKLIPYLKYVEG